MAQPRHLIDPDAHKPVIDAAKAAAATDAQTRATAAQNAVQANLNTHAAQYAPNQGISSHMRMQYAYGGPSGGVEGMVWFYIV